MTSEPSLRLALMLWCLVLTGHILFTLSVPGDRRLLVLPFCWVVMGLGLTGLLRLLIGSVEGFAPIRRWMLVAGGVLLLTATQAMLNIGVANLIIRNLPQVTSDSALFIASPEGNVRIGVQIGLLIYFWVYGCYAVSVSLLLSQRRLAETRIQAQQAELTTLRLQLQPHFLFNALNSLSALVATDQKGAAVEATARLSSFLRTSLVNDLGAPVALGDELDAVETYLDVERSRFGEKLVVEFDVPEDLLHARLPVFLIQPLVENAIKYAVAGSQRPVTISVTAQRVLDQLAVVVADDGPGGPAGGTGTGIGHGNIRRRLAILFGDRASLQTQATDDGYRATLRLPLMLEDTTGGAAH
ncbi:MAG: hypothetical protein EON90_05385 [Brevundimonas sp.]|nr:MAG: hypothetical protein EON90_05385 [Brevundimonas sp.]